MELSYQDQIYIWHAPEIVMPCRGSVTAMYCMADMEFDRADISSGGDVMSTF